MTRLKLALSKKKMTQKGKAERTHTMLWLWDRRRNDKFIRFRQKTNNND